MFKIKINHMKTKKLILASFTLVLFSCNKNAIQFTKANFEKNVKEFDVTSRVVEEPILSFVNEAQSDNIEDISHEHLSFSSPSFPTNNSVRNNSIASINKSGDNTLTEKEIKVIEKIEKKIEKIKNQKEQKKGGLTSRMKIGIILAAVGIILIVLGGISSVFWLLGVIALVIGAVLILMEVLEM